jgi:adenylate cyclase
MAPPRFANATLYWICVAVMAVALVDLAWLHVFRFADNTLSDRQLSGRAEKLVADPDIVVIDIDDYSLHAMDDEHSNVYVGRWPWPRSVYGELIAELEKQGVKAVVFDVEFYERDRVRPEQDEAFNEAIRPTTNTFFAMQWLEKASANDGMIIADYATALALPTQGIADTNAKLPLLLPNVIDKKAWGRTGSINFNRDDDGVGRRYYLWRNVGGWRIPSLPARVSKSLGYAVPDDESMLLSWLAGGQHPHRLVSFFDIYSDLNKEKRERAPLEFKDKIVVIGATASGLQDFRYTPVHPLTPGVEILATAIDNLKRGMILRPAPQYVSYALVVLSLLLLLYALERRWNLVQIFGLLSLGTVVLVGGAYAALSWSILLPVGRPLLFAWTFYFLAALLAYVRELRERTRTEAVLSRVLDPRVAKRLVAEGVKLEDIKSEQRTISVLFSDIRGFTTLSETRPAGEIVALLNRYFSMQAETVFKHGGALDKFIGDAIMAFWGAPTDDARHAEHAVACALDMAANLARFNAEIADSGIAIDIGVGIHTGTAVVGFVGSQRKLEYTAIGDTVNLASRIEGETKGRTRILVTEATRDFCDGAYDFRDFGEVHVKGRAAGVRVFAPEVAATNAAPDSSGDGERAAA